MEIIDALKELQKNVQDNEISDSDYEEIRSYVFLDPDRLTHGYTTKRAIETLRRLFDSNKISEDAFLILRDKVSEGYIETPISSVNVQDTKPEPILKGPLVGFLLGFFLNIIGMILCITLGDKKSKVASIITTVTEISIGLLITIILIVIFVLDPNILFPGGL